MQRPHLPPSLPGLRLLAIVAVVLAAATAAGGPASARTRGTSANLERRQELADLLAESSHEELRVAGELDVLESEWERLEAELAAVEAQLVESVAAQVAAEALVEQTSARASAVASKMARTDAELARAVALIRSQAVSAFIASGAGATLNDLLGLDDPREVASARAWTGAALERQEAVVRDITRLRGLVEQLSAEARLARQEANEARTDTAARRNGVEAARETAASLRSEAAAAAVDHAALLGDIHTRRLAYEAELAALEVVSSSIAAALQAAQTGQTAAPATRGTFAVPVPTARLSSRFGPRTHPIFGNVRIHAGLDLSAPSGTAVGSAGDGVVVAAGVRGGYGNAVVIDHGGALATLYGHLSRIDVAVGQHVMRGEVVALVGSTGNSTGPHLHFEVRRYGTPVDPLAYL